MAATLQSWVLAARPKTLWAGASPVLLGSVLAWSDGSLHLAAALAALVCAGLIQIGTNLANDYYDARHGVDREERIGPRRVTQSGLLDSSQVKRAFILCFLLAVLLGAYLLYLGGWPVLLIGLSSVALGWLYTAGPAPLSYTGLADLFAFLYFGPVAVMGTYWVQAHDLSWPGFWAGTMAGFFSLALLTVNNFRDLVSDSRTGKRSLTVRFGASFGRWEYRLSLLAAGLCPLILFVFLDQPVLLLASSFLILVMLGLGWKSLSVIPDSTQEFGESMNRMLTLTGKLELQASLLFAAAYMLT